MDHYPFPQWDHVNPDWNNGVFYKIIGANPNQTGNKAPYDSYMVANGHGYPYMIKPILPFNTKIGDIYYLGSNGVNSTSVSVYFGIKSWDLQERTIQLQLDSTNYSQGIVDLKLIPKPSLYYDDTNSTLKRYAPTNNIFSKTILNTENLSSLFFSLGKVKLKDSEDTQLLSESPNSDLKFFPGEYNPILTKRVIYLQDTNNNKTLVLKVAIGTGTEPSSNKALREYIASTVGVYKGLLDNSSINFIPTTLEVGENYKNTNAPLFQVGVESTKSYTKPFYDEITYGDFTFKITGGVQKSSSFKLTNPIPKALSNGTGTYQLVTGNTNPSGLSTNQNTLSWTTSAINTTPGYTQYNSIHKIGVWFIENGTTVKAASFTTDSAGKITGSTKTGIASIGGNTYKFGDFGNGIFSIGLQSWNFLSKSGIQMKILHFTADKDPLTALEGDAVASDTFTFGH